MNLKRGLNLQFIMRTLAIILIAITALFGVEINAQNCYLCGYLAGLVDDVCSPANFNKDSALVEEVACPNNGKCYTLYAEAIGREIYTRSCTTYETPGTPPDPAAPAKVCGQNGVSCCDGDLCNGENAPVVDTCYVCSYLAKDGEAVLDDDCTPENFDPSGDLVGKLSCPGDNKCYAYGAEAGGVKTFGRGCTADEIPVMPVVTLECGKGGVQCCEGDLCNGAEFGGTGRGVSLTSMTITATCILSVIGIMLFD